jgi:hypothetical protein
MLEYREKNMINEANNLQLIFNKSNQLRNVALHFINRQV